jgi:diguanylate cyclase (GGDEF)-like protein/PAS domain S-box-containing protein
VSHITLRPMDAVSALLRAAIRIADAGAAIVAFDDEPHPVAFAGCSQTAATAFLRDGAGEHIDCHSGGRPTTLVLVEPVRPAAGDPGLAAVAHELGRVLAAASNTDEDLRTLAESITSSSDPVAVFVPPQAGEEVARFAHVNAAFERLFGYAAHEIAGETEDVLFGSATNLDKVGHTRERLARGEPIRTLVELRTREDFPLWIELTARVTSDGRGRPQYYVMTLRDVSGRREFEAAVALEKLRLSVTLKAIGDAVITVLPDGRIDSINHAAQRLLNVTFAEAYGMPLRAVIDLRDARDVPARILFDPNADVRGEGLLYGPERNAQIAFVSSPIAGSNGVPFGYVVVLRDVTAQARQTRRMAYEASHDPLTRLPNRRHFEEMVANALETARQSNSVHTLAYIDLESLNDVTDRFGAEAGDRFLREVAHRMSLNVRGNDVLARLGGDEFAVLLHECTPENAARVAEKIRQSVIERPAEAGGVSVPVGAKVGLFQLDRSAESAEDALAAAGAVRTAAKAARTIN